MWHRSYIREGSQDKASSVRQGFSGGSRCQDGMLSDRVCLNPSEGKYGLEIPSNTWHSIIALESGTVIFEIKKGPYQPLPSEDLASWAPQISDAEGIKAFMKRMLEL